MLVNEPFEVQLGQWIEGRLDIVDSLAAASIAACRDQLREHRVPLVDGIPADEPRKQVAIFHDSSIDIRIDDDRTPRFRKRRIVANLGPQAVKGFWSMLRSTEEDPPEALADGAIIILKTGEDPECTKVALTRSSVPERHHPEHEYVHINPGTLIRAQQSYPSLDRISIDIRPDFYSEILSRGLGADLLLSAAVDVSKDMLRQTELLPFSTPLSGSEDGSFAIEPPVAIDFLEV